MFFPVNVNEFEPLAQDKLLPEVYDFCRGGANDEITLAENRNAYDRIKLLPKVLTNRENQNLSIELFGQQLSSPIMIAPTGLPGIITSEGEKATARAAKAANIVMALSMMSNFSLEEVSQENHHSLWFQLYLCQDKYITESLVQRVKKASYTALIVTVDTIALGKRERDLRNQFNLDQNLQARSLLEYGLGEIFKKQEGSSIANHSKKVFKTAISWQDLEWLKEITDLPIIIKGILNPEDAALAIQHGVSGIIVSNHGGRQLDTTPATIDILPEIAATVEQKVKLFIDGGIRRGTDILKALALGADAVLIGRPILWGLAVGGEQGALKVINILQEELELAMTLCGFSSIAAVKKYGKELIYSNS
jgi:isopentenyl diphosphate isomerase/L-lactate dehydrogenase-like FMN-dependent dehydrogenase